MVTNSTPLTLGIIGLRDQGLVFGRTLAEMGHRLIGVDISANAREEFKERFGADTCEDLDQLFEYDIDGVVVASPNKYHVQPTITALQNGYDVFVEKPLANDLESAQRIAAVERDVDPFCMVGHHFRHLSSYKLLKEYVNNGYFGDIYHVESRLIRRRGIPGRGSWYTSSDIAGGGAVMDLGSHSLDLIFQLFESTELKDVMSVPRTKFGDQEEYTYRHMHGQEGKPHRFDVEDSATVLLETTEGQTANLEIAWAANCESKHEYYIYGTEAGAYLDLTAASFSSSGPEDKTGSATTLELFEVREIDTPHFFDVSLDSNTSDPYMTQFNQYVESIRDKTSVVEGSVDEALAVQKAIHEIYE